MADQGRRPLGPHQPDAGRLGLQHHHFVVRQPERQLARLRARRGRLGGRQGRLRGRLHERPQIAGPSAARDSRRVEAAGQVGRKAKGEAVHRGAGLSDIAGAKPILP